MAKMSEYHQAQAEEQAHAADPSWPDISEFDRALAEVHALMQDIPIPSPSDK